MFGLSSPFDPNCFVNGGRRQFFEPKFEGDRWIRDVGQVMPFTVRGVKETFDSDIGGQVVVVQFNVGGEGGADDDGSGQV